MIIERSTSVFFAGGLFSRNFAMAKFCKYKRSRNVEKKLGRVGCTDQIRIVDGRFSDNTKACLKIMMAVVNNSEFQYFLI